MTGCRSGCDSCGYRRQCERLGREESDGDWYAVLAQVVLAAVMVASHAAIIYAKHPIDPDHPRRHRVCLWCVLAGLEHLRAGHRTAGSRWIGPRRSACHHWRAGYNLIGIIGMFIAVAALVGALMIGVYYGQNGARVYAGVRHSDGGDISDDNAMPYDDDLHWIGGIIYINRDDPAIMIPKRFRRRLDRQPRTPQRDHRHYRAVGNRHRTASRRDTDVNAILM